MKESEALQVVAWLNAGFPREALEGASIDLYASEVGLLVDAEVAGEAAKLTVRNADRFPSISEFRRTYRGVAESRASSRPALPEARFTAIPEWVHVWWWLRRVRGVGQGLPQQSIDDERGNLDPAAMSMAVYEGYLSEWVGAGSPEVRDVFKGWRGEAVKGMAA